MKILQVINTDFGFNNLLKNFCESFIERGHDIEILCAKTDLNVHIKNSQFKYHYFEFTRGFNIIHLIKNILTIKKIISKIDPDILHLHTPSAAIITRLGLLGFKKNFKIIYTCHAFYFSSRGTAITKILIFILEYITSLNTDIFLFQSKEDYNFSLKYFSNKSNSFVIGNGVDPKKFDLNFNKSKINFIKNKYNLYKDKKIILINGRLVQEKGHLELIKACQNIDCYIIIIGHVDNNNKHAKNIKSEIDKISKLDNFKKKIHLIGYTKDVPNLLQIADIFVLPTYGEGLNRSIIEAMFASLPIITTNILNNKELVINDFNGFLVPVRDVEKLRKSIIKLLGDADLREEMGNNSKNLAYSNNNIKDVVERHIKYMQL